MFTRVTARKPAGGRDATPEPTARFATARAREGFASARSGGEPLGEPLRSRMEDSFGHDFSAVRVHQSERAAQWGAVAVAHGDQLHFAPGRYQPATAAGRQVIGHELTHVVQQRQGLSRGTAGGAGALEGEAASLGERAANGRLCPVRGAARGPQPMLDDETAERLRAFLEQEVAPAAVEPILVRFVSLFDTWEEVQNYIEKNPDALRRLEERAIAKYAAERFSGPSLVTARVVKKRKPAPEEEIRKVEPISLASSSGFRQEQEKDVPSGEKEAKKPRLIGLLKPLKAEMSEEEEEEEEAVIFPQGEVRREDPLGGSELATTSTAEQEQEQAAEAPLEIAAPSKKFLHSEFSFESILQTVQNENPRREETDPAFKNWKEAADWTPKTLPSKLSESKHLADLKSKARLAWKRLDPGAQAQVATLFGWLIPLQRGQIKAINSKENLVRRLNSALENLIAGGGLPTDALIRHQAPLVIAGPDTMFSLGVESEIITGKLGAVRSGEPAEGGSRAIEAALNAKFRPDDRGEFKAGHLVADSLGGKYQDWNLTPITNQFNTSSGLDGLKDPENRGAELLKNRVIHYKATATYGNREDVAWWRAVLPTRIEFEVSTMKLKMGGDSTDIRDWNVEDPATKKTIVRDPLINVRWPRGGE